jgi:hypothetical protein
MDLAKNEVKSQKHGILAVNPPNVDYRRGHSQLMAWPVLLI